MSVGHGRQNAAKGNHGPIGWFFDNAADRLTFTVSGGVEGNPLLAGALTADDLERRALDKDTGLEFRLTSIGPEVWTPVGGTGTGGAGHLESWSWTFDDLSAADSDPGAGNWRLDNLTQASALFAFISDDATNGATQRAALLRLHKGQHFTGQEIATAANFHVFEVTGDPIAATGYVKVPVTIIDSGVDLTANLCGIAPQYSDIVNGSIGLVRTATDALATTPTQVVYDTALVQNTDYFSFAAGQVTILKAARFFLSAEFTADITAGALTCLATVQLFEDVGAGFVAIPEAISQSRAHNTSTPEQHVVISSFSRDFAVGDIVAAFIWQAFGTATTVSLANHSRLHIMAQELP